MGNDPLVSIVMSVHNGEKYLNEAIDSILKQTYNNFEFIVINDYSNDRTADILYEYNDVRIKLLLNDKNIGLASSLNKGINISSGKYVVRMDADDIALPERLMVQVRFMEKYPKVDILGSQAYILQGEEKTNTIFKVPLRPFAIKGKLLWNSSFIHPTVIIRKSSMDIMTQMYNPEFRNSQDYELWERMVFDYNFNVANIKKPLLYYRIHTESISVGNMARQSEYAVKIRMRVLSRFGINGLSNLNAYNAFAYKNELTKFSSIRLSLVLRKMYDMNSSKSIVSHWNLRQLPYFNMGYKGIQLYYRTRMYKLYSSKKQLFFIINSIFYSLTALKK